MKEELKAVKEAQSYAFLIVSLCLSNEIYL